MMKAGITFLQNLSVKNEWFVCAMRWKGSVLVV